MLGFSVEAISIIDVDDIRDGWIETGHPVAFVRILRFLAIGFRIAPSS